MTEADVEISLQRGLEKYPYAKPRIISDNGPQFIARDFKEFIRVAGLTHVRTSPYYPHTTPCASIRRSATSPQPTNSPAKKRPSSPLATKNS
jgi:hypothetical protein